MLSAELRVILVVSAEVVAQRVITIFCRALSASVSTLPGKRVLGFLVGCSFSGHTVPNIHVFSFGVSSLVCFSKQNRHGQHMSV